MKIIKKAKQMQTIAHKLKLMGKTIGVVPTMGALHEGHLSLVRIAKKQSDIVILTIFVNPSQFSPNEDFSKYPRTFNNDKSFAQKEKVDYIFYPEASEMYGTDFETYINCEKTSKMLEGEFRPIHFRGVTTIVAKLFNITEPNIAVFGQKDAQQAFIIEKMVKDLNFNTKIIIAPICRTKDGLALSSRNVYLSIFERDDALILSESLKIAKERIGKGERNPKQLQKEIRKIIDTRNSSKVDYIRIVDASSFTYPDKLVKGTEIYILLAVRFGKTRLIDNIKIKIK
jgi:pantoate--beta-alanine ligase